jgi:1,6-anhydro-N-acetylmuramate kinase
MWLRKRLSPSSTVSIEKYDIDAPAHEALATALLAAARLDGASGHIPQATGADRPAILGTVYQPPPAP